ncbi:hypothetical protein L484_009502 [Morus notabilis]|uniref:Prolamin-like domain-containing protein n=1 Tax=Morus notabilis TaxID=981085 RepID=W9R3X3_9ROSA|nr:hypothetical protein L484_009502 [Morus notabilis]
MKNSGLMLVFVVCLALCTQDAYSLPWWKRLKPAPPPTESAGAPSSAPIDQSSSKPHLPKWLHPPTADEIARCESAHDFNTKWKPCLDESLQQRRSGIFTPGPVCCDFVAGVVEGCYSKFSPQIQDLIYPPLVKEHCSQYH